MKIGLSLHPERGVDAVFEEARQADAQGYDSIWIGDHLMSTAGDPSPDRPLESFTLGTALGAITSRTRIAWAMLNLGFRRPSVLAKSIASLDHITHGRVICAVGSGWFKEEYEPYDIPLIDDHDERIQYAADVIRLFRELWTHPTPEKVTFEGKHVRVRDLAFTPAPFQKPHPPIWFGGDSEATLALVKEQCDGWVMLRTTPAEVAEARKAADWPTRPMTIVKTVPIFVHESREEAREEVERMYEARSIRMSVPDLTTFIEGSLVGSPDDCIDQLREIARTGINYLRVNTEDAGHQERIAKYVLPRLESWED